MRIKHLACCLLVFFLSSGIPLSCFALDDGPDIIPPTRPGDEAIATVQSTSSDIDVTFLEDSNDAELEVVNEDGTVLYKARGGVSTQTRLTINVEKQNCVINVRVNNKAKQVYVKFR